MCGSGYLCVLIGCSIDQNILALLNTNLHFFVRGSVVGFFTSFVKNGEIRPSFNHKIILEQREEGNQLNS